MGSSVFSILRNTMVDARPISCSLLLLLLLLHVNLAFATSRPFPPNHASATVNQPLISQSPIQQAAESGTHLSSTQEGRQKEAAFFSKEYGKLGSSPPSCERKCYGCSPCEAIQVPTTSRRHSSHVLRLNYADYKPEGWKCKCGPSFYSP